MSTEGGCAWHCLPVWLTGCAVHLPACVPLTEPQAVLVARLWLCQWLWPWLCRGCAVAHGGCRWLCLCLGCCLLG